LLNIIICVTNAKASYVTWQSKEWFVPFCHVLCFGDLCKTWYERSDRFAPGDLHKNVTWRSIRRCL